VAEVRSEAPRPDELTQLAREVVAAVHRHRGLRPARVLLVRPQTIPKTSSGKIQRSALATLVAEQRLDDRILHGTGARAPHAPDTRGREDG
jgi:acyl-coenzyme A synthetase/AMP-(fatty) acid ligase